MKPEDRERFAMAMAIMGEAFQKKPSDTMTEVYWRALVGLSVEAFERASLNLINTRKITGTFPLVAEIREAAQNTTESLETRIAIAWDMLIYALKSHGTDETIIFDDPLIHYILKSWGGWQEWGNSILTKELKWARKDFEALYRAYSQTKLGPPPPCIGFHEHNNRIRGYDAFIPEPIYITGKPGNFRGLPRPKSSETKQIEDSVAALIKEKELRP